MVKYININYNISIIDDWQLIFIYNLYEFEVENRHLLNFLLKNQLSK